MITQCSSQSAPLRESHKKLRDGPQQKRSRAIMALSFTFLIPGAWSVSVTSTTNVSIKQNF